MYRIQLVGTQRSGSNVLRLILGSLPGVFAPPSAHELRDFLRLSGRYQPLLVPANARRLVDDIGRLVDLNALAWPSIPDRTGSVLRHLRGATVAHAVIAFYDAHALLLGYRVWVNKCLENFAFVDQLSATLTPLVYVHLVRDPRDVAMSFARAPIGPKEPRAIALAWRRDQEAVERAKEDTSHGPWFRVRYEDLVRGPRSALAPLCEFTGIRWTSKALDFYRGQEATTAAGLSPLWENLSRPLDPGRIESHKKDKALSDVIEAHTCDLMARYGYRSPDSRTPIGVDEDDEREIAALDRRIRSELRTRRDPAAEAVHLRREEFLKSRERETTE